MLFVFEKVMIKCLATLNYDNKTIAKKCQCQVLIFHLFSSCTPRRSLVQGEGTGIQRNEYIQPHLCPGRAVLPHRSPGIQCHRGALRVRGTAEQSATHGYHSLWPGAKHPGSISASGTGGHICFLRQRFGGSRTGH